MIYYVDVAVDVAELTGVELEITVKGTGICGAQLKRFGCEAA